MIKLSGNHYTIDLSVLVECTQSKPVQTTHTPVRLLLEYTDLKLSVPSIWIFTYTIGCTIESDFIWFSRNVHFNIKTRTVLPTDQDIEQFLPSSISQEYLSIPLTTF